MALPGRTISARGVERAKTHKDYGVKEREREDNNGWLAETFLVFLNRFSLPPPPSTPPYLSRWRTDSSISHENELAFPGYLFSPPSAVGGVGRSREKWPGASP